MIDLERDTLVKMIDHTELSAHSGEKKIANLCSEARTFGFYTVCINGGYTRYAYEKLQGPAQAKPRHSKPRKRWPTAPPRSTW
jgi:deoxyribose-phosphate aldolase